MLTLLNQRPFIFAHRGASATHPENTLAAFQEAHKAGAHGIEYDVQLTKDDIPVVIHDAKLNRTTNGKGLVKNYTLEEIKKLDAGGWFGAKFCGETVPTLGEVLNWVEHTPLSMNIELKNDKIIYPHLEHKVLSLVKNYHLEDRVIFSSFNYNSLLDMRQLDPNIRLSVLFKNHFPELWPKAQKINAFALHCSYKKVSPLFVQEANQRDYHVFPYTVNNEKQIKKVIASGCSGFITDDPKQAVLMMNQGH